MQVVFDLESRPGRPTPIGEFVCADEDSIVYERPDGTLSSAPADCVRVVPVDVMAPNPLDVAAAAEQARDSRTNYGAW